MARPNLKKFRRIVVKVGSSLLIDSDAGEVRATWLAALAADEAGFITGSTLTVNGGQYHA
jgi:glutamate 5-kinase